jgi:hypothetical protein
VINIGWRPVSRCGSQVRDPADGERQHNHEHGDGDGDTAPDGAHGGRGLNDEHKDFILILNGQGYRIRARFSGRRFRFRVRAKKVRLDDCSRSALEFSTRTWDSREFCVRYHLP